jgi:hypothetical protein
MGTVIHPKDLYFIHHVNKTPIKGICIEFHRSSTHFVLNNNNNIVIFRRKDHDLKILDQQILPLEIEASALRTDIGLVESHTIREIFLLRRKEDQQNN